MPVSGYGHPLAGFAASDSPAGKFVGILTAGDVEVRFVESDESAIRTVGFGLASSHEAVFTANGLVCSRLLTLPLLRFARGRSGPAVFVVDCSSDWPLDLV